MANRRKLNFLFKCLYSPELSSSFCRCPRVFEFIITFREANVCVALIVYPLFYVSSMSTAPVAGERRRISGCHWFGGDKRQPEIRLRSQATAREKSRLLSGAHDP